MNLVEFIHFELCHGFNVENFTLHNQSHLHLPLTSHHDCTGIPSRRVTVVLQAQSKLGRSWARDIEKEQWWEFSLSVIEYFIESKLILSHTSYMLCLHIRLVDLFQLFFPLTYAQAMQNPNL